MDDDLLSVREVAALCHVRVKTVYNWIAEGALPTVRLGQSESRPRGTLRIRRGDVAARGSMCSICRRRHGLEVIHACE